MKALFSGQAGLAVVLSQPPVFRPVNEPSYEGSPDAIWPAFSGFVDVEEMDIADDDFLALDKVTEAAWAKDRGIYRLYMLFDDTGIDPVFELAVVNEYSALVCRSSRDAVETWLEGVDLGPKHEERARALALKYPTLRVPMVRLYASVEQSLLQLKPKVQGSKLYGVRVDVRDQRQQRPDSADEREARTLLEPILEAARQSLKSPHLWSGARSRYYESLSRKQSTLLIIKRALHEANEALRQAGLERSVQLYSVREMRALIWEKRKPLDKRVIVSPRSKRARQDYRASDKGRTTPMKLSSD